MHDYLKEFIVPDIPIDIKPKVVRAGRRLMQKRSGQIKLLYGDTCFYCLQAHANTIDHFIPLIVGGSNHLSNLVPSCAECNYAKGADFPRPHQIKRFNYMKAGIVAKIPQLKNKLRQT